MNRIFIIVGGLILVLIISFVLVWPAYQNLQLLKNNLKQKEADLRAQEDYYAQVKKTSAELLDYSEALAKIQSALPRDPSTASLANFFQANAAQTGLILKKIVLEGTVAQKEGKGFRETGMVIQLTGSYKALKDFLSTIESSSRMIEARSVSAEFPLKTLQESPVFTLNLKTYSY